mmetsp:Transcript_24090/g.26763  ORF Transcript_24090/g.26763 Transcript_24090/m.26763 type:complete len:83 (-) Transcript_24090:28-276(-)
MRGIQALAGNEVHCIVRNKCSTSEEEDLTPEATRILESIILLPINKDTSEENIRKVWLEVSDSVIALDRGIRINPERIISKI